MLMGERYLTCQSSASRSFSPGLHFPKGLRSCHYGLVRQKITSMTCTRHAPSTPRTENDEDSSTMADMPRSS